MKTYHLALAGFATLALVAIGPGKSFAFPAPSLGNALESSSEATPVHWRKYRHSHRRHNRRYTKRNYYAPSPYYGYRSNRHYGYRHNPYRRGPGVSLRFGF